MQDEINFLHENQTWELFEKPQGQKAINSHWVYTTKVNPNGTRRFKTRLVLKDYSQVERFDYEEKFSLVVRFDSVRKFLAIAARGTLYI